MLDPDSIQVLETNLPNVIEINEVPEFETEIYNLDDEKDYEKFITDCERTVRKSFEYRELLKYLRENFGMDKCAFLKDVTNAETYSIKIEIHHFPLFLHDIVDTVIKKRIYYKEYMSVAMVSKEVMMLHYRMMVGLIPLSETVHELYHSGRLFIPIDKVFGRYNLFIDYYKPFMSEKLLDGIERIEKYTKENSEVMNTTILETNNVSYNIKDNQYTLPNFENINTAMLEQLTYIKQNGYMLPGPSEVEEIKKKTEVREAITFFE